MEPTEIVQDCKLGFAYMAELACLRCGSQPQFGQQNGNFPVDSGFWNCQPILFFPVKCPSKAAKPS